MYYFQVLNYYSYILQIAMTYPARSKGNKTTKLPGTVMLVIVRRKNVILYTLSTWTDYPGATWLTTSFQIISLWGISKFRSGPSSYTLGFSRQSEIVLSAEIRAEGTRNPSEWSGYVIWIRLYYPGDMNMPQVSVDIWHYFHYQSFHM